MRLAVPASAALVLGLARTAAACPTCSEAAGNDGYGWAIILMLAGVFGIGGGLVFMIVRVARRLDAAMDPELAN